MLLWPVRWLLQQVFQMVLGLLIGVLLVLWTFRWVPLVPVPVIVALLKGEGPSWQWLRPSERPPGFWRAFGGDWRPPTRSGSLHLRRPPLRFSSPSLIKPWAQSLWGAYYSCYGAKSGYTISI
jgi:hypothetical protein